MILAACYLSGMFALAFLAGDTVNAAIIAGLFSVVNTIIGYRILRDTRRNQRVINQTKSIVDRRETQRRPPDGEYKREEDHPV